MGKNIIAQRRGKGSPTFRAPSHRHPGPVALPPLERSRGVVTELLHAPGRSAPLARVRFPEREVLLIAPDGLAVGQEVTLGHGDVGRGNIVELAQVPEGTLVYNVELQPGDGGKLCRAAGATAVVVGKGDRVTLQMPSGQTKSLDPRCRAQVGVVAGAGHREKPLAKAGKKVKALQSKAKAPFKTRGVAMNAASHPHGGGSHQHVGRPSTVSRNAPPGRKVGRLSPKKKKGRKR